MGRRGSRLTHVQSVITGKGANPPIHFSKSTPKGKGYSSKGKGYSKGKGKGTFSVEPNLRRQPASQLVATGYDSSKGKGGYYDDDYGFSKSKKGSKGKGYSKGKGKGTHDAR